MEAAGMLRTCRDAGCAGNALFRICLSGAVRRDRTHRTDLHTGAAPVAVFIPGGVERSRTCLYIGIVSLYRDGLHACRRGKLSFAFLRKCDDLFLILFVRAAGCDGREDGMLRNKSGSRYCDESLLIKDVFQFQKSVIISAVSVNNDGDGRRMISLEFPQHLGTDLRQTSAEDREGKYGRLIGCKCHMLRRGTAQKVIGDGRISHGIGQDGDHFLCRAGCAEINVIHFHQLLNSQNNLYSYFAT